MDFKVKCISEDGSGAFTIGKTYEVKDGVIILDCGEKGSDFTTLEKLNSFYHSKFEIIHELPRICYILGGEDNPLKVGERFEISGYKGNPCYISDCGEVLGCAGYSVNYKDAYDAINHPEKIIRQPQFSDDEKTLMRLYVGAGYPWFARDKSGGIEAYEVEPDKETARFVQNDWDDAHTKLLSKFFSQITWENSPFNSAEYLEGLK